MIVDYTLEYKPVGFYKAMESSECRGMFDNDAHFNHFKHVQDISGRKVTNVRIIKG